MTCNDAPDWTDTAQIVVASAPTYPHSVWGLAGITPVNVTGYASGVAEVMYTVPTGKVFYLTCLVGEVKSDKASTLRLVVTVEDEDANLQFTYAIWVAPNDVARDSISYPVPIRMLAGWTIWISLSAAPSSGGATVHGYTLPA